MRPFSPLLPYTLLITRKKAELRLTVRSEDNLLKRSRNSKSVSAADTVPGFVNSLGPFLLSVCLDDPSFKINKHGSAVMHVFHLEELV